MWAAGSWTATSGSWNGCCGRVAWFAVQAVGQIGHALRFYRKEIVRLIAEAPEETQARALIARAKQALGM